MKRSFWKQLTETGEKMKTTRFPTYEGQLETDVAVIGGGITGLSTALELAYRGVRVVVLEAQRIGMGTTGRSSGHIDAHPEIGPRKLLEKLGHDKSCTYINLRKSAIRAIESRASVQAKFKPIPGYMYSENFQDLEQLKDEFDAALEIGLPATWQDAIPLDHAAFGYRIDGMGRINSLAYVKGLAELVTEAGGKIFENSLVEPSLADESGELKVGRGTVRCKHVVCATHFNFTASMKLYLQTPPFQSYIIAARLKKTPPDALYWDNANPYYYTRIASDEQPNVLIAGGCDHHTGNGQAADSLRKLENYVKERYEVEEVLSSWSSELFEPSDGMPMIGELQSRGPEGEGKVWVATGLSGVGLTWGTAAGWLLADQIIGKETPLESELSPKRFGISELTNVALDQQSAIASYSERVLPAESIDPVTLQNGEGKVGKVDGQFVAICRDQSGCLHSSSPICTHMGGVLNWNEVEQTWDCPVHGGRFSPDGERLYGPPSSGLESGSNHCKSC